jgi:ornithine cyclodeaminase/alanine dehydrogenase
MSRSGVFVDSMDTAIQKSGDLLMAVAEASMGLGDVRAELGDVVAGLHPGRRDNADITLFNSVGIGMQDLAIGRLLYDAAMSRGLGQSIDLAE